MMESPKTVIIYLCMLWIIAGKLDQVNGGWTVVFKAVTDGSTAVYNLYTSSLTMNTGNASAPMLDNTFRDHYKSADVNNWENLNITRVKLSVYKNNVERAYYIFNGTNTDRMTWMSRGRLLESNYLDLMNPSTPANVFSVYGFQSWGFVRPFHINLSYNDCPFDVGWLLVYDVPATSACPWENIVPLKPIIIFSHFPQSASQYSNQSPSDYIADFMAIQIYTEETTTVEYTTAESTTAEYTTSETQTTTTTEISTNTSSSCWCFKWPSDTDWEEVIKEIIKDLKIEKTTTSKFYRSKNSIMDDRPSVQYVGYSGILFLCIVLGFLVIIDSINFCKITRMTT